MTEGGNCNRPKVRGEKKAPEPGLYSEVVGLAGIEPAASPV